MLFFFYFTYYWLASSDSEKDKSYFKYVSANMINAIFGMMATGLLISILKCLQRSKKYGWFDLTICTLHLLGFIIDFKSGGGYFHEPTEV